jgi:hypothetical protein
MLEEDYLALNKHNVIPVSSSVIPVQAGIQGKIHSIASQIVRQIILPQLEKEVNTGRNFANLRQIFNSIILSSWYKKNLKQDLLNQVYADKSKVKGIERPGVIARSSGVIASEAKQSQQDLSPDQIYNQYLKAYKKGVFNYIKDDVNTSGKTIPRKYFSGGIMRLGVNLAMTNDPAMLDPLKDKALVLMSTGLALNQIPFPVGRDAAMKSRAEIETEMGNIRRQLDEIAAESTHKGTLTSADSRYSVLMADYRKLEEEFQLPQLDVQLKRDETPADREARLLRDSLGYDNLKSLLQRFLDLVREVKFKGQDPFTYKYEIPLDDTLRRVYQAYPNAFYRSQVTFQGIQINSKQLNPFIDHLEILINDEAARRNDLPEPERNPHMVYGDTDEEENPAMTAYAAANDAMLTKEQREKLEYLDDIWTEEAIAVKQGELQRAINTVEKAQQQLQSGGYSKRIIQELEAVAQDLPQLEQDWFLLDRAGELLKEIAELHRKEAIFEDQILKAITKIFPVAQSLTDDDLRAIEDYKNGRMTLGKLLDLIKSKLQNFPSINPRKFTEYVDLVLAYNISLEDFLREWKGFLASPASVTAKVQQYVPKVADILQKQGVKSHEDIARYLFHKMGFDAGPVVRVDAAMRSKQEIIVEKILPAVLDKFGLKERKGKTAALRWYLLDMINEFDFRQLMADVPQTAQTIINDDEVKQIREESRRIYWANRKILTRSAGADNAMGVRKDKKQGMKFNPRRNRFNKLNERYLGILGNPPEDPMKREKWQIKLDKANQRMVNFRRDRAQSSIPGGIDFNTQGMSWKIGKDGKGVEMNIDPAMIERIKREGVDSLSPVIFRITPVTNIWSLFNN